MTEATFASAATAFATMVSSSPTSIVQTNPLTGAMPVGPAPRRGTSPPSMPGVPFSPVFTSQYG